MKKNETKNETKIDLNILFTDKIGFKNGQPDYTRIVQGKRNRFGKVVMMDCNEFLKIKGFEKEEVQNPQKLQDPNCRFAKPLYDINNDKMVGKGRVLICRANGIKEVPVAIIANTEKEVDKWLKD